MGSVRLWVDDFTVQCFHELQEFVGGGAWVQFEGELVGGCSRGERDAAEFGSDVSVITVVHLEFPGLIVSSRFLVGLSEVLSEFGHVAVILALVVKFIVLSHALLSPRSICSLASDLGRSGRSSTSVEFSVPLEVVLLGVDGQLDGDLAVGASVTVMGDVPLVAAQLALAVEPVDELGAAVPVRLRQP